MKAHIVSPLQITHKSIQAFRFIIIWPHLTAVASQDSPVAAAVFLGCRPKCLGRELSLPTSARSGRSAARAAVYFPLCALGPPQLLCSSAARRPAGLYLSATSSQPSSGCADTTKVCASTLSYPAGRPKHGSNLVLAENGLISAGGDQEKGRRE